MAAGNYDLVIDQGSDFALSVTVSEDGSAKDLSTWDARASLRSTLGATTATNFTVDETNAASGILVMSLPHGVSTDMEAGYYVYDLEIYQGTPGEETKVTRLLQGEVTLRGEVTR